METEKFCTWGEVNGYVDCGFMGEPETIEGHRFCDVHADCVESDGIPAWLLEATPA